MAYESDTTLRVSKEVSQKVKEAAAAAKLSIYEFVNLALKHFVENATVSIDVKEQE